MGQERLRGVAPGTAVEQPSWRVSPSRRSPRRGGRRCSGHSRSKGRSRSVRRPARPAQPGRPRRRSPSISWPSTWGRASLEARRLPPPRSKEPSRRCRSLWQTPQWRTSMRTSVPLRRGRGAFELRQWCAELAYDVAFHKPLPADRHQIVAEPARKPERAVSAGPLEGRAGRFPGGDAALQDATCGADTGVPRGLDRHRRALAEGAIKKQALAGRLASACSVPPAGRLSPRSSRGVQRAGKSAVPFPPVGLAQVDHMRSDRPMSAPASSDAPRPAALTRPRPDAAPPPCWRAPRRPSFSGFGRLRFPISSRIR